MSEAFPVPKTQGLVLFEVYEKSGALLLVTSSLADAELLPTDYVVRRPWASAAESTRVKTPAEDPS